MAFWNGFPKKNRVEVSKFVKKESRILANLRLLLKKQSEEESPKQMQQKFLRKISKALKKSGTLYLAIENRYDFSYFLGLPDPHCGIRFISLMPRQLQNILSLMLRGRAFRNWTYSQRGLIKLLHSTGFSEFNFYYGFPDYRVPELVLSHNGMRLFRHWLPASRRSLSGRILSRLTRLIRKLVFKRLRLTFFAPSFIVHAYK